MNSSYLYTETAFHHEGNKDYLKDLVDASVDANAKGVKFQVLIKPEERISSKHSAYKTLESFCLTHSDWNEILEYTAARGLDIILMPIDNGALRLLDDHKVKYLDIHSISYNDHDLREQIKQTGIDVILGVGGRTFEEIVDSVVYFGDQLKVLMVGFQSFPTRLEDVKLNKIAILRSLFPDLQVGYADHSSFSSDYAICSNEFARILGAEVFEKHIAVHEGVKRTDFEAAVSKEKVSAIIKRLEFLERNVLLPTKNAFQMDSSEVAYRNRQLRCVATRQISQGEKLGRADITLKMVEVQNNAYAEIEKVVGKTALRPIDFDETLLYENVR